MPFLYKLFVSLTNILPTYTGNPFKNWNHYFEVEPTNAKQQPSLMLVKGLSYTLN